MSNENHVELEGTIVNCGGGGHFRVQVEENHVVVAKLSGRMRKNRIRIVLGDRVKVAVSTYDPNRGIITFRER